MEEFPTFDPERESQKGLGLADPRKVVLPDKEKFLVELSTLLKAQQSNELIGTFQAGTIPIILDTLARDTSKEGRDIVASLYEMIESVKTYYKSREPKAVKDEVKVPVKKPLL